MSDLNHQITNEELQELAEHQQVLQDIQVIMMTDPGQRLVKYLFKHFEVNELPMLGLHNDLLLDKLGSLRPGRTFYRLVSEANPQMAGILLSQVEKEKIERERYELKV